VLLLALAWLSQAQPVRMERRVAAGTAPRGISGADWDGNNLFTWGKGISLWSRASQRNDELLGGEYGEGGCPMDVDRDNRADIIVQEGSGLGKLVWRRSFEWTPSIIDTETEAHDVIPAELSGRRGILTVHRYGQARFYEIPADPRLRWPYREIYSFYTPSRQAGLLLADVDGDGRKDIYSGNYWIRSPEEFDLPWRLFAINTYKETPASATLRLALADLTGDGTPELVVAQGEMSPGRLAWFEKPADPRQLWIEHRLEGAGELRAPHGLATADLDGDGGTDIIVAENGGPQARLLLFRNEGGGKFEAHTVGVGSPLHTLRVADLNGDGAPDVLAVGPQTIEWWENRTYRRK